MNMFNQMFGTAYLFSDVVSFIHLYPEMPYLFVFYLQGPGMFAPLETKKELNVQELKKEHSPYDNLEWDWLESTQLAIAGTNRAPHCPCTYSFDMIC